jgi:voltage-gated potassium channel
MNGDGYADQDRGRIVIFGEHSVAMEVAGYLHAREFQVLIIDDHGDKLVRARDQGYQTAELDFRDDSELQTLDLSDPDTTVFSLFSSDAENVFLIISIRALSPQTPVITIAQEPSAVSRLQAAGAERVIDVHEISGRRIWDMLSTPLLSELLESTLFGKARMNLAELAIEPGSALEQRHSAELALDRDFDLIVIGVVDAASGQPQVVATDGFARRLQVGDTLLVIGHDDDILRCRESLVLDVQASRAGGPPQSTH